MEVTTRAWRALGTSVQVVVHAERGADEAATAVASVLDAIDRTLSRFRPDSEISAINAAAGQPQTVSPLMAQAVRVALDAAQQTEGAVDPTIGRALRLIGYDDDFSVINGHTTALRLRIERVPGWQRVRLVEGDRSLHVPRGVELDFGSTGKALAADLAAADALVALHAAGQDGGGVLVCLGGDLATAGVAPDGGWHVLAAEDSATPADADGEVVSLSNGALATSSTTVRRWTRGGVELHHIIDPQTGLPVDGPWRTVTVAARTCVAANTAATAAIVRGAEALAWLGARLPARLVAQDGSVVRAGGWPEPDAVMPVVSAPPAGAMVGAAA